MPANSLFKKEFKAYLKTYGHRAVYEGDLTNPRWREDPSYLLNFIRSVINSANYKDLRDKQENIRKEVSELFKTKVPLHQRKLIQMWLWQAIKGAELREMGKSKFTMLAEPLRILALEIGRRFKQRKILHKREEVFYCTPVECVSILLGYWDGKGLFQIVKERRRERQEMEAQEVSSVIIDEKPQFEANETVVTAHGVLVGLGVSAGKATGKVRLIHHPQEGGKLNHKEILVAPSTDPAWTPLFLKAGGIVMEVGGNLSHGAIVAREYGIPAVVNVSHAMKKLHDGQEVTVDGSEGKVYI